MLSPRRLLALLACFPLCLALAHAQGSLTSSGSANFTAIAHEALSCQGNGAVLRNNQVRYLVEVGSGQAITAQLGTTQIPRFESRGGVVWTDPALQNGGAVDPIIFGISPSFGPRAGGTTVRLIGAGLDSPLAQFAIVRLGLIPATNYRRISSTEAEFVTGSGRDPVTRNSLGVSDLEFLYAAPQPLVRREAFAFLPALYGPGGWKIGSQIEIHLLDGPGPRFWMLWTGLRHPTGINLSLPFDLGQIVNWQFMVQITPIVNATLGSVSFDFAIPNDPSGIGFAATLQALSISDVLAPVGSLTNPLDYVITAN